MEETLHAHYLVEPFLGSFDAQRLEEAITKLDAFISDPRNDAYTEEILGRIGDRIVMSTDPGAKVICRTADGLRTLAYEAVGPVPVGLVHIGTGGRGSGTGMHSEIFIKQ